MAVHESMTNLAVMVGKSVEAMEELALIAPGPEVEEAIAAVKVAELHMWKAATAMTNRFNRGA